MKSRWWCFTNFDLDFDWQHWYETNDTVIYIAYGEETCPTTKRLHQQGWFYVKNSIAGTSRILPKIHTEIMRGSIMQNDRYCSKEAGELIELGSKPRQGQRRDLNGVFDLIKDHGTSELELAESNPAQWCQYGRRFEEYRALLVPKRQWKSEVIVFWGPAGSGKTKRAWEMAPKAASISFHNGFVIGYKGERDVIIDDFEDRSIPRYLFLQMTDRYPMRVNIKNGDVEWSPQRIFITSNFDPNWWYGGCPAVKRRLDSVDQMFGTEVSMG